ncbi:ABC transporter ATP-binding protein [Flavobacterium sp. GT3R68]|uniref:ABC transporter ATP-binding protein n=1 Tax=Flavobacterium sp. GT3R68 TaxID=2594437 RepID=UPI000F8810FE|nr:ABC transporter ATP-binding protein [Flavobacterium sp. GT3R68]RTY92278.1 ABC transporter ATP-binding protein [Flavobacterium sp. GSN2]TRW92514.1 ABC transporter ATP-binding protein [Flavobacterium sp. GT3R68]
MSKDIILKAENISKQYRLGQVGTGTISHDINRWWHSIRGKENPYLKIGDVNDRSSKGTSDYVWALQDINFEINQGDAVGIIGKNGAGKSTLLKLLSRVTAPTTGVIKTKGRIASLLEVGTGFHPELTGRENIYLNGAILGMSKSEISKKLAEIIDFSGVERYIDTPVKRYSSGMYVRLAFAVAAHLESEILIVDEVLSVGDAEFQKKCLGKMGDISKGEGRTVLFVSHQLGSVATLCNKGMLMDKGKLVSYSNISSILENYTSLLNDKGLSYVALDKTKDLFIDSCTLYKNETIGTNEFLSSDIMSVEFEIFKNKDIKKASFSFTIQSNTGDYLSTFVKSIDELLVGKNSNRITFDIDCSILAANSYFLRLAIFDASTSQVYDLQEMICPFKINDEGTDMAKFEGTNYGYFNLKYNLRV